MPLLCLYFQTTSYEQVLIDHAQGKTRFFILSRKILQSYLLSGEEVIKYVASQS